MNKHIDLTKAKVGDKYWRVPTERRSVFLAGEVTVTKVGRKFVYFDDDNSYYKDTGMQDAGEHSPYYYLYPSVEYHDELVERSRLWSELSRKLRDVLAIPAGVTPQTIRDVISMLRL